MKRTKFFAAFLTLALIASLGFGSCSNDDDNSNTEASEAEQELEATAFSVLRSLTDLAKYDPEAVKEDEDDEYIGVETLPSNWKSMTFACDQGTALSSDSTVRLIAANGIDDAKEFFASMIGEEFTSDTYAWNYAGLGSLTFTAVSGNDDLFATIDVAIDVLPDVKELRFLSENAYDDATAELNAENSFSGIPYYSAGDIIQRTSDGTYWICVRPAGGPLRKDKSYWICLNPLNTSGKNTLVKTTTENVSYTATYTYKAADGEYKKAIEKKSEKWTFAKNLMSLKTAKAAHHTFNLIANPWTWANKSNQKGEELYKSLCDARFDLRNLMNYKNLAVRNGGDEIMDDDEENGQVLAEEEADYDSYIPNGSFCFAYGSVTKDSKRITSGSRKNAGTKYIQPFLFCTSKMESEQAAYYCISEQIFTMDEFGDSYSATNSFDGDFVSAQDTLSWQEGPYNIENFLHTVYADGVLGFSNESAAYNKKDSLYAYHIFFSPELCIKDNKGKTAAERPVGSAYKDIYRSGMPDWWWASLETSVRHVDGVAVNWNKENE